MIHTPRHVKGFDKVCHKSFITKSNENGKSDHLLITVTSILKARKQRKSKLICQLSSWTNQAFRKGLSSEHVVSDLHKSDGLTVKLLDGDVSFSCC